MCRLAAYLGPPIALQQFLIDPSHSLYRQASDPRELKYARLNADGFGFGWFAPDCTPAVYASPAPIWTDANLPALARSLRGDFWIAQVRSATAGSPVHQLNTQPFCDDSRLFAHNGFISDFHELVRPRLLQLLEPGCIAGIRGNTDSEYLFAWLRQILLHDTAVPATAMQLLFARLAEMIAHRPALLNIVLADRTGIYAARYALNHDCPSLYYSNADPDFPGGQLLASERFSQDPGWRTVPGQHCLVLRPDRQPELQAL